MGSEDTDKVHQSPNIRRYALFSLAALILVAMFLLTREKRTEDELLLTKMYETKYQELEALLAEKDAALNETYSALQKTFAANKMQEESVKTLSIRLKQHQADLEKKGAVEKDLHSAQIASTFLAEDKKQAEMTVQMCRQEAAAALQEKELAIMQHQQALERAREDVEELQRAIKQREGEMFAKETAQKQQHDGCRGELQVAHGKLLDRERSLHWLVEKKRADSETHAKAIADAKTERDCHQDIQILREELNKVLSKQKSMKIVEDIKTNHGAHTSTGKWLSTSQLPEVAGSESSSPVSGSQLASGSKSSSPRSSVTSKTQNAYLAAKQSQQ